MSTQNRSLYDRINVWMKKSITLRLITIVILTFILMIPLSRVKDLIREREWRNEEAKFEVSEKWGGGQNICGPILTIPFWKNFNYYNNQSEKYEVRKEKKFAHFLPEELNINAQAEPQIRNRGIFEIILYESQVNLTGQFSKPEFSDWSIDEEDIIWNESTLSIGLSDLRGIKESITASIGKEQHEFQPGLESQQLINSGVSLRLSREQLTDTAGFSFQTSLSFNGSNHLLVNPLGKETKMRIESGWKDPKFTGAFLPMERVISEEGFTADWKVLNLNRSFPQRFLDDTQVVTNSAFGVEFNVPVGQYQKSMRSVKYALLLISLTFLMFFFVQIIEGIRIHPIQYLIVGFALCLYYILLIALSEHLSFSTSYIVATSVTITMITFYINSFFRRRKLTMISFAILGSIYLFIYIILLQQDYALLIGSIGLFVILGIVMYLSQRIDWFEARKVTER